MRKLRKWDANELDRLIREILASKGHVLLRKKGPGVNERSGFMVVVGSYAGGVHFIARADMPDDEVRKLQQQKMELCMKLFKPFLPNFKLRIHQGRQETSLEITPE